MTAHFPGFIGVIGRLRAEVPNSRELLSSSVYALVGSAALRLAQVGGTVFLARTLPPAEYGRLALVLSTLAVFVTMGGMGGGLMGTRFVAERKGSGGASLGAAIVVAVTLAAGGGTLAAGLVYWQAAAICQAAFHSVDLVPLVRLGCLFVTMTALNDTVVGVLRGFRAFKDIAWNQSLQAAVLLIAYVVLVPAWGGQGAIAALSLSALLGTVAAIAPICRGWRAASAAVRFGDVLADFRLVWHFSLPAMLSGMISTPALWLMNTALAHAAGGFAAVALFNVSSSVRVAILFLPLLLIQVVSPFAMDVLAQSRERFDQYMQVVHDFIALPTYACSLALVLFVRPLLAAFGPAYREGYETLALVLLSVAVQGFGAVSSITIQCTRLLWKGLVLNAVWALALVAVTEAWAHDLGARAAALAYFVAYGLLSCGQAWLLRGVLAPRLLRATLLGILCTAAVTAALLAAGSSSAAGRCAVLAAIGASFRIRLSGRNSRIREAASVA